MRVSRVSFGCRFVVWRRSVEGDPRDPLTTVLGGSQNNIFDTLGALERSRSCHARFQGIVWESFCCLVGVVWGEPPTTVLTRSNGLVGGPKTIFLIPWAPWGALARIMRFSRVSLGGRYLAGV